LCALSVAAEPVSHTQFVSDFVLGYHACVGYQIGLDHLTQSVEATIHQYIDKLETKVESTGELVQKVEPYWIEYQLPVTQGGKTT